MFNTSISKNRSNYLDIAKGLGIIMVVWGHSSGPFSSYIGQFHMPLFFLISGFLFNSKSSLKEFVIKKIKNLYIPFIVWNLLITVIKFIMNGNFILNSRNIKGIFEILLMLNKDGQFFGATWFLGSLFFSSILYKLLYTCLNKYKYKVYYITIFFILIGIIGFQITFPYTISRTFILSMFYAIGYLIKINTKNIIELNLNKPIIFISSLFGFIIIGYYNSVSLSRNEYNYRFLFVIGALCASYVTIYVSKIISNYKKGMLMNINNICCLMGKNSIDILIWQFVAFRIVIAIQLKLDNISLSNILNYYPTYKTKNGWWIVYIIVGISISILLGRILKLGMWAKILKKYRCSLK